MVSIVVLGDSLSVAGYGITEEAQTWPFLLQRDLGAGSDVKVCAQGGMLASLTDQTVDGAYFGCSKHLGRAMNAKADAYLICLGTNDAKQGTRGFTIDTVKDGLVRIVLQLRATSAAVFSCKPEFFFVPPPNLIGKQNALMEGRRQDLLPAALSAAAAFTGANVLPMTKLSANQKHRDGIHLNASGARAFASSVVAGFREQGGMNLRKRPAEDEADRFRVLKMPHLGLDLRKGKVYTRGTLVMKCAGEEEKLTELDAKLSDPDFFERC